jgi:hypothetical protein
VRLGGEARRILVGAAITLALLAIASIALIAVVVALAT